MLVSQRPSVGMVPECGNGLVEADRLCVKQPGLLMSVDWGGNTKSSAQCLLCRHGPVLACRGYRSLSTGLFAMLENVERAELSCQHTTLATMERF